MRRVLCFAATSLFACLALAQSPEQMQARKHFREGLAQAQSGDLEAAIVAFEAAYTAQPHHSVLYNIGQAQAALGRLALALASWERYLAQGGSQIDEARRAEVQALISATRKRLGILRIVAQAPERTRIWLDGEELQREQLEQPLLVMVGKHTILYSIGSGAPRAAAVTVSNGAPSELRVPALDDAQVLSAQLHVDCVVPGMSVSVDDKVVARTPLTRPVLVAPGERALRISRIGYRKVERKLVVEANELASVTCDHRPEPDLAPTLQAAVVVRANPHDAIVLIDGRTTPPEASVPFGLHELRVEHASFKPYRRIVSLEAGRSTAYDITLQATPATQARLTRARSRQKTLAYVLGGTGAALLAASGSLFLWNQRRYDNWQASQASDSDLDRVASLQRVDDLSLGLAVFGTGLAAGGTWLFFREPEPTDE